MGALEDMCVFLVWGFTQRAVIGIAWVVPVCPFAGGEIFMAELDEVALALTVCATSRKSMGLPIDQVGNVCGPTVSLDQSVHEWLGVGGVPNSGFQVAMNCFAVNI